jgi:lipase
MTSTELRRQAAVLLDVPVDGGTLRVHRWGDGAEVVLLLHGITGTGLTFQSLAPRLAGCTVLAPDLRGRGGSRNLPAPFGLDRHVDDLTAVLRTLAADDAVTVVGHSMGAAVATHLAVHDPGRVARLVLVDGGPILPVPPGMAAEQVAAAMLGPSLQRLTMTFPSRAAYHSFWRAHPAFADTWGPHVEAFLDSDLIGEEPELRSCVSDEAVEADGMDLIANVALRERFGEFTGPVTLLRAPRDLLDRPQPLLPDAVVEQMRHGWPQLEERTVPDVNHYTILLSEAGAADLAREIRGPHDQR